MRLKRPVGQRLATSAMVMVYGGTHAFTGPTIAGCAVTCANATTKFSVSFDKTLLRGSKLVVRPYDTAFPNRSAFLVFANLSAAEQAWIPVNVAASTTDPTAIEVDLAPLKGAPPLAVRYAWSGLAAANGDDVRCCMKDVLDGQLSNDSHLSTCTPGQCGCFYGFIFLARSSRPSWLPRSPGFRPTLS